MQKCGMTIYSSSIIHDCKPLFKNENMETFNYEYDPNMERYISRLVKEWKEHKKIILCVDFDDQG